MIAIIVTTFKIIAFIIIFCLAILGYFSLGLLISIFNDPYLGEVFINKYMDYLIKKYPNQYHKDETDFYWVKDCDYGYHAMSSDKRVKKFTNIVYTLLFIFWPIDFLYKIIKYFKYNNI